jgi:hypothetical protein
VSGRGRPDGLRAAGLVVAVYVAVGVGLAAVEAVATAWVDAQFVAGASGPAVTELGPAFLALAALSTTVAALLVGPAAAAPLGAMAGSRFLTPVRAAGVGGAGSLAGCVIASGFVAVVAASTGGPQAFPLATAALPVAVAGVAAGLVGAVGGAVGSALVR